MSGFASRDQGNDAGMLPGERFRQSDGALLALLLGRFEGRHELGVVILVGCGDDD
jgi:hypothetical protein